MYRLGEKYGEAELEQWVEKARRPPEWLLWWINGMAVGAVLGWALGIL